MQLIESAAASLPLLSALPRLRCGSTCPRATGGIRTVGTLPVTSFEDGWDPRFVQEQVGHEPASTPSIYTCVSSDFRKRTLRRHLDATVAEALERRETRG